MELSAGAKSIKKRKGYGVAFTLSNSTSPVHGVYNFYDTDGSDVSLFFNDRNVNRSVSGQAVSVIYSTATNGVTWQCTDSAGFAYCANTGRDGIFKIDASAISLLSGFTSTGTMVAVTPERLVQSGFSTDPNAILFSKANDFSTWTLGGNPTDPIQFTITAPGSGVKCIAYGHGRVYWWKDSSFGYILEGATQADWRVVTIDPGIGSTNNTYIYREEILYFQAQDGHFYAYDGSQLVQLSKDIANTITATQGRTSGSWIQTSQSDFLSGATSPQGFISSSIVSGQLMPSSFTVTETTLADFAQGTFSNSTTTSNSVWLSTVNHPLFDSSSAYGFEGVASTYWTFGTNWSQASSASGTCGTITPRTGSDMAEGIYNSASGPGIDVIAYAAATDAAASSTLFILNSKNCSYTQKTLSASQFTVPARTSIYLKFFYAGDPAGNYLKSANFIWGGGDITFYMAQDSNTSGSPFWYVTIDDLNGGYSVSTGAYTSKSYDTLLSTNLVSVSSVGVTVNDYSPSIIIQGSHDNSNWVELGSALTSTSTVVGRRYLRYISSFTVSGSSDAFTTLDNVTLVARSTGAYLSAVHNSPNLSSWDTFSTDQVSNDGTLTYSMRSATGAFTVNSSTPAWSDITVGAIPTISTNPYFQVRSSFTITAATQNPTLNSFVVNWFEGSASDKSYAIYHDDANWWSVTSGTGATTNNRILRFDLLNPGWYIYDIGMAGMYIRSQSLYFGSVADGKVFKFGDVDNDNGSAINSYWQSKDFFGANPFLDKNYTRLSSVHPQVSNSTMTVTYTIDGSTATAYNVNLTNANSSFIQKNVNLPQGRTGKTINVKFGNNASDQPWEVFGAQVDYTPKTWVPSQ